MQNAKLIAIFAVIVSINACIIGGKTMPFNSISEGLPGPPGPAGPGTFTEETSIVSVRAYGATGDGVTGDRDAIYEAIAAASNSELLFPAGTYRVESDLTFSSTVAFRFPKGAKLSVDSGVSVTINGPLEAGLYQIFSGDGSVNIGGGAVPMVYPQWWGAVGDDSTDNTDAFKLAIAAISNVGTIFVPAGIYRFSNSLDNWPINYPTRLSDGIILCGAGIGKTVLKYMGTSGYLVDMSAEGETTFKAVCYTLVENLEINADNLTAEGGGVLYGSASHNTLRNVGFRHIEKNYGIAIHGRRRNVFTTEDSYTTDTHRDFTSSGGGGASEKYGIKFTAECSGKIKDVTLRLKKTGNPAGTIYAAIYDDDSGKPGSQVVGEGDGGNSDAISCSSLSSASDGGDITFTWTLADDMPGALTEDDDYWVVLETSGYTYEDGVTEVILRVDVGDGTGDGFATYDGNGGTWSTSNDGCNIVIKYRFGQSVLNKLDKVFILDTSAERAVYGVKSEEDTWWAISDCNIQAQIGLWHEGRAFIYMNNTQISTMNAYNPIYCRFAGSGGLMAVSSNFEGGSSSYPSIIEGGSASILAGCILGYFEWDAANTPIEFNACLGPLFKTDDPTMLPPDGLRHKVLSASNARFYLYEATIGVDNDALDGNAIVLNSAPGFAMVNFTSTTNNIYTYLTRGTYLVTVYAKDANHIEGGFGLVIKQDSAVIASRSITLTNSYEPYSIMMAIASDCVGNSTKIQMYNQTEDNIVYISHVILEYIGTDILFRHNIVSYDSEGSDKDDSRKSAHLFIGRLSGEEQCVLASITASHDGNSDDEKGRLEFAVNNGSDNFSPTPRLTLDSAGKVDISGRLCTSTIITLPDGDNTPSVSSGNVFKTSNTVNTTISMFDDGEKGQMITVIIGDNNTTIDFTGANLKGNGGTAWTPISGDHMNCMFGGANWYCTISDNTP